MLYSRLIEYARFLLKSPLYPISRAYIQSSQVAGIVNLLSILTLCLLLAVCVLDNIINIAIHRFAELVNSFRADRLVVPQTVNCTAAYVVLVD